MEGLEEGHNGVVVAVPVAAVAAPLHAPPLLVCRLLVASYPSRHHHSSRHSKSHVVVVVVSLREIVSPHSYHPLAHRARASQVMVVGSS